MWCDVMWCDVMWCCVVWCDVIRCDVMWYESSESSESNESSESSKSCESSEPRPVSQARLAHLWVDFRVILYFFVLFSYFLLCIWRQVAITSRLIICHSLMEIRSTWWKLLQKLFLKTGKNRKRFVKCVNMWYRIPIHGMMMMITIDSGRCWFLKVALWWWVCGSAFEVTRSLYHHIIAIITSPPPPSPPSSPLSPSPSPSPSSPSQLSGGACSRRLWSHQIRENLPVCSF